jgi:general secretion pathway protein M
MIISLWQQNQWLRGLAFIAGNLAVGIVIAFAWVLPIRDFFAERDQQIIEHRMALARLRTVARQEAAVQAAAAKGAVHHGEFLIGKAEGVISADLQTRLKGMTEAAGAKLRSVRALPAQSGEQTKYVGSRIEIFGPLGAIHRAVHAIESARPYLFVKGAAIRLSPPIGQIGVPQEPIMEAQLDVFGAVEIEAAVK